MSRTRPAALLLALLAFLVACPALARAAGAAPGPSSALGPARSAHVAQAPRRGPTVSAALQGLLRNALISEATFHSDYATYVAAKRALAVLSGTRRAELAAVLANVQAIAAAGQLSASRVGATFVTLERNLQLWSSGSLPAPHGYVSFPNTRLVWEYYPGQGVEIQWLASFGRGNSYWARHEDANLRQLLGEAIPLAAQRGGAIAWEYMFQFDGGVPPWTSGLSQGTALQLLARAYARLKEPAYLTAAQQALALFEAPPPQGVRVTTPAGAIYAEYTYAPNDRILNGFIQALVGLYDYTAITHDPLGAQLFEAGDAEARAIVPRYNTGAWSLYDQFGESDLSYHELLAEFLTHLCERTRAGAPLSPGAPLAADAVYCTTARAFDADLHAPPVVALLSRTLRGATRAGVQVSLSKIALVELTISRGTRVVRRVAATLEHGDPRLLWVTPAGGGTFTATITATDLAGNIGTSSGTLLVQPRAPHVRPPGRA